ncbi:hypothetical protein LSTR_LSTR009273 [Laodelphax striatellus]|uniref:Peptidase M12B domain-containing protein n=1 Tax=Laodelphax striatellus TaxID=195883 RepID=A0A482X5I7_LAOST|nr:hypothetical protein LSTR_LSTR009273 [Laodelphax striatellus]
MMKQNIYLLILLLEELQGHLEGHHTGIYSGAISNFHVVVPKLLSLEKVDSSDVNKHHINKRQVLTPNQQRLQIELDFDGRKQILDLWRSNNFIADHLTIEKVGSATTESSNLPIAGNDCHYRGTIIGQNGSSVALSMCNGIVGFIRTDKESYWLEPSKMTPTVSDHRHFVKRTRLQWQRRKGSKVKVQGRKKGKKKRLPAKNKGQGKSRPKRSISKKHHVECLVVADSSMIDFYQEEEIETYLLMIMNMVNVMYHDASIGNYINIVVVRILLLEDEASQGLNVTENADVTLDSFCRWQRNINHQADAHPLHHDVAILITRQDICAGGNAPCSTLGVAHVEGMCHPDLSCSVNEDNGITLAHTIAHELGHNFGMYHDTHKSGCPGRSGETLNVMTTSFEADILHVAWSPCSRRDITNFFDAGHGDCLYDEPTSLVLRNYPELPIGAVYNAEYQCKIQFAVDNTSVCTPMDEWCDQQSCIGIADSAVGVRGGRGVAVEGGWGAWEEWRPCSRSCGGGVSVQQRNCDHPVPSHGGAYCLGERTRYRTCNTQACQYPIPSFRAEQCTVFNGKLLNAGLNVTWLPYFDTSEPCQLFCTDADETVIMPMGVEVKDGTPCRLSRNDMCIAGLCRKVGCDWKVDSELVEDRCGNCIGDKNQCSFHENYFNKSHGIGYVKIALIPKDARNIIVQELGNTLNYIGVGSAVKNKFYLNGDKAITLPGEYIIADSQALYEREKEKERIYILGPIRDNIIVYLIFQDGHKNQGIHYEYTLPENATHKSNANQYHWRENDWTTCSVTCGQGEQLLAVVCQDLTNHRTVADDLCLQHSQRPKTTVRPCSLQPCLYRWWTGPWQVCPITCGDFAQRHRTVICVTNDDVTGHRIAYPDSACADQLKPPRTQSCAVVCWEQAGKPCHGVGVRKIAVSVSRSGLFSVRNPTWDVN